MSKVEEKLKEIMALVFKVSADSITEETGPDDLDNWDSIGSIMLISAIQEAFDIEFEEEDLLEMLNYQLIKIKIEEKLEA